EVSPRSLHKRQQVQRQREDFINIDVKGSGTGSSMPGKIGTVAKPARKTGIPINLSSKAHRLKRGEQYVSSRRPPDKRISFVSTLTPAPIPTPASSPMHKVQLFAVAPPVLPNNAQYWGTMYDLNGRRLGMTYAFGDALPSVGFAMPSTSKTVAVKRVFVGSVQHSWGFAKHPAISDLKPLPHSKPVKLIKCRKLKNQLKMRHFIGNDKFLRSRTTKTKTLLKSRLQS
ncbi:hypothetical protein CVT25_014721, partial [Psilocybe cyanescens]